MQANFYDNVICSRESSHRYWAVHRDVDNSFVAMTGLTDIAWENGIAEISLLVDPAITKKGIGKETVGLVLAEAFGALRLLTVFGECYLNNDAVGFWESVVKDHGGSTTTLPRRKWWNGQLWDSLYFTIPAP
jgi:GNAT superfamily N-acetyltransferase